jgi:hypothetical protein
MRSIAQDIIGGNPVTTKEVKYLLWLTLCQLQSHKDTVYDDEGDQFIIDNMLDQLDLDLGLLPGGGE